MLTTKRKPASVGEVLTLEFMQPMGLTQAAFAQAMGVQRKHVNELCNDPPSLLRSYGAASPPKLGGGGPAAPKRSEGGCSATVPIYG